MEFMRNKVVKLISSDDQVFVLSGEEAITSKVILEQIEEEESDEIEIPITEIRGVVLAKVVDFMRHYYEAPFPKIPKPITTTDMSNLVPEWYFNYIRGDSNQPWDMEALSDLFLAANYLSIDPLLELAAASFASQVREKSVDQLKELFEIHDELPSVDNKTVRQAYSWAIEDIQT